MPWRNTISFFQLPNNIFSLVTELRCASVWYTHCLARTEPFFISFFRDLLLLVLLKVPSPYYPSISLGKPSFSLYSSVLKGLYEAGSLQFIQPTFLYSIAQEIIYISEILLPCSGSLQQALLLQNRNDQQERQPDWHDWLVSDIWERFQFEGIGYGWLKQGIYTSTYTTGEERLCCNHKIGLDCGNLGED